jgi:hypothetical protein
MYPCACGCVSTCLWPCAYRHLARYPHGRVFTCTWIWIYIHNLIMHNGPEHRLWFCAMGQSTNYGSALWARAQIMVLRSGPEHRLWFCTVGQSTDYGSALWATAQIMVLRYGPQHRLWFCAKGQSTESFTTEQNQTNLPMPSMLEPAATLQA